MLDPFEYEQCEARREQFDAYVAEYGRVCPQSTELVSRRLGDDLLAFLGRLDSDEADSLAKRVEMAAVREARS